MSTKTLIAIGDPSLRKHSETSSFSKFMGYSDLLKEMGIDFVPLSYKNLMAKKLPEVETDCIIVLLFFPYIYWNKNIEVYTDGRIYGDKKFGRLFNSFFAGVNKRLKQAYKGAVYVNPLISIRNDRDKKTAKKIFARNKIPTPALYNARSPEGILKLKNLFIKPRYGAMGKGVSYMEAGRWYTNFTYRNGRIISPRHDYRWKFSEITGNVRFLEKLLKAGFICEEAIESPVIGRKRFDLRIYVVYGKVPYIYARTVPKDRFITNWSQGGKIEKGRFLKRIPPAKLREAKRLAVKTAKALNMNFCGVDVIFSGGFKKAYVLEAHSFPSYERGFDLFGYLIEQIGGIK